MRAAAARNAHRPLLKIKLGTPDDMPRLEAVRAGAPPPASSSMPTRAGRPRSMPSSPRICCAWAWRWSNSRCRRADDDAGRDRPAAAGLRRRILPRPRQPAALHGKYDMINIKLDKTGGLTEALALRREALAQGFGSWSAAWSARRWPWRRRCWWRRGRRDRP
jgi:L-Ala-D/L-Glu epimerase